MTSILLVEDDSSLGETLTERLAQEGYQTSWVTTVKDSLTALKKKKFDLIVVDIGLPDGSGFEVAREARLSHSTPVIMLTAMNSAEFRLEGFEIGVDDYIPKPFHLKELLLRIEKVRIHYYQAKELTKDGITLALESGAVHLPDGKVEYPIQRDFELLTLLLRASPKILSREEILKTLWKNSEEANARSIDNSIVRLRALLGSGLEKNIRSVRGVGYQWVTPSKLP
jgi:two-component system phosphate regulon response regulator PhoB